MQLNGRTALITGSAKRIGEAVALRLAAHGCNIAVHFNRSQEAAEQTVSRLRAAPVDADLFHADLQDPEATQALVPRVCARFGRLDILVNNASIFETMRLDDFDLVAWGRALQINLTAPMILTHAAAPELRQRGGRVVNLCDVSTQRPWPDHLAYMASKGGLETLTKALARALAPDVNVVGVAPGVAEWPPSYSDELKRRLTKKIPAQRAGSAEDIAAAVEYLIVHGDYVTGTILPVDGGRHVV